MNKDIAEHLKTKIDSALYLPMSKLDAAVAYEALSAHCSNLAGALRDAIAREESERPER